MGGRCPEGGVKCPVARRGAWRSASIQHANMSDKGRERARCAQRAARSAQRGVDINCLCAGVGRTLDAEDRCLDSHAPDSQSPPPPPPPSNIIDWTVVAAAAAYCFVCVCPYVSETSSASLYHRESLSLSLSLSLSVSLCVCVCDSGVRLASVESIAVYSNVFVLSKSKIPFSETRICRLYYSRQM